MKQFFNGSFFDTAIFLIDFLSLILPKQPAADLAAISTTAQRRALKTFQQVQHLMKKTAISR